MTQHSPPCENSQLKGEGYNLKSAKFSVVTKYDLRNPQLYKFSTMKDLFHAW